MHRPVTRINLWGRLLASQASCFHACGGAASKASKLRQGSGGAAPSGVQGQSPWRGVKGRSPPGNFCKNRVSQTISGNKEKSRKVQIGIEVKLTNVYLPVAISPMNVQLTRHKVI